MIIVGFSSVLDSVIRVITNARTNSASRKILLGKSEMHTFTKIS